MERQLELKEATPAPEAKKKSVGPARRQIIIASAVLLVAVALALNFMLFGKAPAEDALPTQTGEEQDSATLQGDGYFSATQVSRQRARDEALEVLQSVVDSEEADEATKTGALLEIAALAKAMEAEANIETLILAKGFAQCVAIINDDSCSVVVSADSLQPQQIAQINEIVYEQAGIKPANIRIVAK